MTLPLYPLYNLSNQVSPSVLPLSSMRLSSSFPGMSQWPPVFDFFIATVTNYHEFSGLKEHKCGTSLVVQWLELQASTAEGTGLIPGRGSKIPQAARCSQKTKKNKKNNPQMYYRTVLEVRIWMGPTGLKSSLLLEAVGESPFPCLFQFLEATCIPWLEPPSPSSEPAALRLPPFFRNPVSL